MATAVLLALFIGVALAAPSCTAPAPLLNTLTMCAPYAPAVTYYDPNATSNALLPLVYSSLRVFGSLDFGHSGASRSCFDLVARLVCSRFVPSCQVLTDSSGNSIPAYSNPCTDSCTDLASNSTCLSSYIAVLQTPSSFNLSTAAVANIVPNCTAVFPSSQAYVANQPMFGAITWSLDAVSRPTVPCSAPGLIPQTSASFPCTGAYRPATTSTPLGYCEVTCPYYIVPDLPKMANMAIGLCWIQGLVCLFAIVLRFTVPKFSAYPTNLVQILLLGWFLYSLTMALMVFPGYQNVTCKDGLVRGTTRAPLFCGVQAVFTAWGILLFVWAWAAIAIHSAVVVILKRDPFNRVTMFVTYGILAIVPFVLMAVGNTVNGATGQVTLPWCTAQTDNDSYGTLFAPMGFALIIGVVCLLIVLVQMIRATGGSSFGLVQNIRLLAFLLLTCFAVAFIWAYRFWFTPRQDYIGATYGALVGCSLFARTAADCPFVETVSPSTLYAYNVTIDFIGTLTAVLFLCQKELWTNWGDRIPPWKGLITGKPDSSTATTAGSSSASSSGEGSDTFMSDLQ